MKIDNLTPDYVDTHGASRITGLSKSWLDKARSLKSDGPRYIQATPRKVLYRVADLHEWLKAREKSCTSDA